MLPRLIPPGNTGRILQDPDAETGDLPGRPPIWTFYVLDNSDAEEALSGQDGTTLFPV